VYFEKTDVGQRVEDDAIVFGFQAESSSRWHSFMDVERSIAHKLSLEKTGRAALPLSRQRPIFTILA
jgi:hypothetical protein